MTVGRPTRVSMRCLILNTVTRFVASLCWVSSPSVIRCLKGLRRSVWQIMFTLLCLSMLLTVKGLTCALGMSRLLGLLCVDPVRTWLALTGCAVLLRTEDFCSFV